jgi:cellulose synthase/poly-beta-1,6-N-acetylglucosamine synthase-like glycosyltransferase
MSPAAPLVSVVVPVLNGQETIGDCLNSVLRTDYPAERREVLVVDNGSRDRTAEIVKRFPVRYVLEERRGVSHARNRGLAESRGELVAFTDADCVVSTRWLAELLRPFAEPGVSGSAGEIVAYPPTTAAERYVARRKPLWQDWSSRARMPWFLLGNTAFRRQVFDRVGAFDTNAIGIPDIDFSLRFFEAGLRLHYCRSAVVFHRHRETVRALFVQQLRGGRGRALVRRRHDAHLTWGWREELRAWSDLAGGAWRLAKTAASVAWKGDEARAGLSEAYVDVVRKVAQRVGFVSGTVWLSLSPRSAARSYPREGT